MKNEFINYTISWYKGELFEARILLLVGLICLVITFSLWKLGITPNAKILIIPALALSLIFIAIGISGNQSNLKGIGEFSATFNSNPQKSILKEKQRMERVVKMYTPIRFILSGIMLLAIVMFLVSTSPSIWKGIAIVLIAGALTILIGDYFSEERSNAYLKYIGSYVWDGK